MNKVSLLLDQGFQKIQDDFKWMMECLAEIMAEFGKSRFQIILPVLGDPSQIKNLPLEDQNEALEFLSLSLQILNVVEQNATGEFRSSVSREVGYPYVSGSVAEVIADLRLQGREWEEILSIWKRLSLQLVFTAHPTESRRSSLVGQLRQFFTDLQKTQGSTQRNRRLILKNLECLMGTGEFIQHKPSVNAERDFITRIIRGSLPEGLRLWVEETEAAFSELGCPAHLNPPLSDFPQVKFRSWVASDRDGHPYVTAEETQLTLDRNRLEAMTIIRKSLKDLSNLLSVSSQRVKVPARLYDAIQDPHSEEPWRDLCNDLENHLEQLTVDELSTQLTLLSDTLAEVGAHLLAKETEIVKLMVTTFGFHLVSQDLRQNSTSYQTAVAWILDQAGLNGTHYLAMSDSERCQFIETQLQSPKSLLSADYTLIGPAKDAIESLRVAAKAIRSWGPASMGSIIVSMTRQSSDLLQVLLLAREAGLLDYSGETPICEMPIVPLIETAEDHHHVLSILSGFIQNPIISASILFHHKQRENSGLPGVRMMCGHSDGGKDAGIIDNFRVMLETREKVAAFLQERGYAPIFFEGVGGTLIRGAAPIKYLIANSLPPASVAGFEYTEQGQIIAQNHLVPFMSAWSIQNALAALFQHEASPNPIHIPAWFSEATPIASTYYRNLVNDPDFATFFTHITPLDSLEFARMGSRPTRRTGANTLSDLRAIPFALCQSQTRFNFTAWYGVGHMLHHLKEKSPQYFHQLCDNPAQFPHIEFVLTNVEMALKSASLEWMQAYAKLEPNLEVRTRFMELIKAEYTRTEAMLTKVFGKPFDKRRPRLARTIEKRKPLLDVLHASQIQALTAWRKAKQTHQPDEEAWLMTTLLTINAISNGLRGTG